MLNPDKTLRLAAQVAFEAERLGIKTALIGAAALAVHGYTRGTEDIDLATYVLPKKELTALAQSLNSLGLQTELRLPDEDDILGGVLVVWELQASEGERSDVVEVVNFWNPARRVLSPAANAIAGAIALEGIALRCVGLQDLIALKLYAGGATDYADILQLLVRNPDIDFDQLRRVAGPFDENTRLDRLIAEAQR